MGNWTSGQESLPCCRGNPTWFTFERSDHTHPFITPTPTLDFRKLPHKAIWSIGTNKKSRCNWTRRDMYDRPACEIVFLCVGTVRDFLDRGVFQDFEVGGIFLTG